MNSGITSHTSRGKLNYLGTHQKFDRASFRLLSAHIDRNKFPRRKSIIHFEGYNGPDGLKIKGEYDASHMWDPKMEIGYLPVWIDSHFSNMVNALKKQDYVRAAFDASWMAHYLTDGLTPAHHVDQKEIEAYYKDNNLIKSKWKRWGVKGDMSSHVSFEAGIASMLFLSPLRIKFDKKLYGEIMHKGIAEVFKKESLKIAQYDLYIKYLQKGWTVDLAKAVKAIVAPRIPQLVAAAWLCAYEQAGNKAKFGVKR
jgi:hypothetical protein